LSFNGFGAFLDRLTAANELVKISAPVDPHLEITEIADRVMKKGGPALLFEQVKGSEFPLAINCFGSKNRMSLALGVEQPEAIGEEIVALLNTVPPGSLWEKMRLLLKLAQVHKALPKVVSGPGACQEVIMASPDLDRLPILTCWPQDGGPYLTLPLILIKDPETGARNLGMYRLQKYSATETGMHWQVHKDARRIFEKYRSRHQKMEVAVLLGGDPVLTYAATAPLPPDVDELLLAGFIRKQGVELVKGITVSLEVPADADFVLEGYVDPDEDFRTEGPFGDHTGFYSLADEFPVFHITAITHRTHPIYPATVVGVPPMEDAYVGWATERIFLPLLRMFFPEIVDIHLPVEGGFHNLAIVAIRKAFPGHGTKIMHSLWGMGQMMLTKCLIIVEDQIDIHDLRQLTWYVASNIDPARDLVLSKGPLDQLDHASDYPLYGGKIGIDATRKCKEEGYTRQWPEIIRMNKDVVERVNALWDTLGITI
jgi:4-hydroxy-3-polyprenylbenzoate decarboxylase